MGNRDRLKTLCAKPSFKTFTIFSSNLVGVEFLKTCICMNRPVYTGFTTLDVSKLLMYDFHYNHMMKKYGVEHLRLLFTDTDSLCYLVSTGDIYEDMREDLSLYDTSNYASDHPLFSRENAKVLGKMKDECPTTPAVEFVGLRPKMYSLLTVDKQEKKTAKGVSKTTIKKSLCHADYKKVLEMGRPTLAIMWQIRAHLHQLYTQKVCKVALSAYEDKRYVLADGVHTLAHGHYKTRRQHGV